MSPGSPHARLYSRLVSNVVVDPLLPLLLYLFVPRRYAPPVDVRCVVRPVPFLPCPCLTVCNHTCSACCGAGRPVGIDELGLEEVAERASATILTGTSTSTSMLDSTESSWALFLRSRRRPRLHLYALIAGIARFALPLSVVRVLVLPRLYHITSSINLSHCRGYELHSIRSSRRLQDDNRDSGSLASRLL